MKNLNYDDPKLEDLSYQYYYLCANESEWDFDNGGKIVDVYEY